MESKEKLTFENALERTGFGLYSYLLIVLAGLIIISQMCTAYGTTIVIPASACELRTTPMQRGVLAAVPVIGLIIGGLFWGYLGDVHGRKPMLLVSLISAACVNAVASVSVNWIMLMLLQFLGSSLSAGQYSLSMTLVSESVPLAKRNLVVLMVVSIFLMSQGIMALLAIPIVPLVFSYHVPGFDIYWNSWRALMLTYSAPSLISAVFLCFVCESPKFLFVKGKESQAKVVMKCIHMMNNFRSREDMQIDGVTITSDEDVEIASTRDQILPLFRPPLVKKLIVICTLYVLEQQGAFMMWLPTIANQFVRILQTGEGGHDSLCGIIRATLDVPPDPDVAPCSLNTTALLLVLSVGVLQSVTNALVSLVVNRTGRRNIAMVITTTCGLLGIAVNLVPNAIASVLFFILSLVGMIVVGAYSAITVASFPTHLRALAMAITMTASRLGTFVSVQILNLLLQSNCEAGFYLFSIMLACSTVVATFLVDDRVVNTN